VKLEWSPLAMADRDAIFDYIEADNPMRRLWSMAGLRQPPSG
jgi:plasmid stabilization system protein ParE